MPRKTNPERNSRGSKTRGSMEVRTPRPKPKIDFTVDALDFKNVTLLRQFVTEAVEEKLSYDDVWNRGGENEDCGGGGQRVFRHERQHTQPRLRFARPPRARPLAPAQGLDDVDRVVRPQFQAEVGCPSTVTQPSGVAGVRPCPARSWRARWS